MHVLITEAIIQNHTGNGKPKLPRQQEYALDLADKSRRRTPKGTSGAQSHISAAPNIMGVGPLYDVIVDGSPQDLQLFIERQLDASTYQATGLSLQAKGREARVASTSS